MSSHDVTDKLYAAPRFKGLSQVTVKAKHKQRLLCDNSKSYISSELVHYLKRQITASTRGKLYHPLTQDKIERWHRSLDDYNHKSYHILE